MEGEYVGLDEYGLTNEQADKIIEQNDWDAYEKWWKEHNLPQGLQLVEMHMYPTLRDYCEELYKQHLPNETPTVEDLFKMAVAVDSMIS